MFIFIICCHRSFFSHNFYITFISSVLNLRIIRWWTVLAVRTTGNGNLSVWKYLPHHSGKNTAETILNKNYPRKLQLTEYRVLCPFLLDAWFCVYSCFIYFCLWCSMINAKMMRIILTWKHLTSVLRLANSYCSLTLH